MGAIRAKVWLQLEPRAWPRRGLSPVNRLLFVAILGATTAAMLRTEPTLAAGREGLFDAMDMMFAAIFTLEYLARVWSCTERPEYAGRWGWARFMLTPGALIDAAVVVVSLAPMISANLFALRLLRLFSIVRFAKLGRLSVAMRHMVDAVAERRHELALTALFAFGLIVFGATAMWAAEGNIQPQAFGSIPRAMWWAAVTLTTIGYGDAVPVTLIGKFIAIVIAIAGIGLIAMPAGILAAAFSDALRRQRAQ